MENDAETVFGAVDAAPPTRRFLAETKAASETADGYGRIVARLNANWRVIECRDRIQWILQRVGSPEKARTSQGSDTQPAAG